MARDKDLIMGAALAVYTPSAELGRVMTVNDFFVRPDQRRKGELAKHLIEECQRMKIDEIGIEVHRNKTATAFWKSVGLCQADVFSSERS